MSQSRLGSHHILSGLAKTLSHRKDELVHIFTAIRKKAPIQRSFFCRYLIVDSTLWSYCMKYIDATLPKC